MGETLKKQAGPLPVWAWMAIGVLLLGGFLLYRKHQASLNQSTANANNQGIQSNLGTVPISNLTVGAEPMPTSTGPTFVDVTNNQPPGTPGPAGPPGTPGAPGPAGPPGKPATPPPPIAPPKTPAPTLTPAPKPAPVPAPKSNTTTVTVCAYPAWCGSLWGIAQHEYGEGNLWPQIYQANKAKIGNNPNLIHPGTVLVIPAKAA